MNNSFMKFSSFKNMINESFRMALDSIRQNKLRSILTLLGISIGVFSVISVMTAIRTLESSVESGLNVFGTNTFVIQKWPLIVTNNQSKYRNRKNINYQQYQQLKKRATLPALISVYDDTDARNIKYKNKTVQKSIELIGGDEGVIKTQNTFIDYGRNITQDDIHSNRKVCILGNDVVNRLFPFEDPLNKEIQIRGIDYNIIGITEQKGEAFGQSQDNYIIIPISNYLQNFSNKWTSLNISIEAFSEKDYDKTMNEVIGLLRTIRKVPPGEENDFEIISNVEMIERLSEFTNGIKLFALAISIIALLVAGIGIMNIMLVSVTDRIKEIGIRKATGATKKDILFQFLSEAIFLSEFGGIIGVIMGISGGNVVALVFNIPAVIPLDWAFYGLLVCSIIGISFGIYPAWRAANLDPIESLRYE
jgi:putative ABC transport system permease protein